GKFLQDLGEAILDILFHAGSKGTRNGGGSDKPCHAHTNGDPSRSPAPAHLHDREVGHPEAEQQHCSSHGPRNGNIGLFQSDEATRKERQKESGQRDQTSKTDVGRPVITDQGLAFFLYAPGLCFFQFLLVLDVLLVIVNRRDRDAGVTGWTPYSFSGKQFLDT